MEIPRRSYSIAIASLVCFLVVIAFVYVAYTSPTGINARRNSDLHSLTEKKESVYTNLEGENVAFLDTSNDEILMVNVWATWSPYTPTEFMLLSELKKTYGDKVRIVALNRMEPKETALAFLETIQKPDGVEFVLDQHDDFFKTVGGYAMPETIIFDSVGNISFHKRGTANRAELSAAIDEVLEK